MSTSHWPKCGFKFTYWAGPDDRRWGRCARLWGHWLKPHSKHMGPYIGRYTGPGSKP